MNSSADEFDDMDQKISCRLDGKRLERASAQQNFIESAFTSQAFFSAHPIEIVPLVWHGVNFEGLAIKNAFELRRM